MPLKENNLTVECGHDLKLEHTAATCFKRVLLHMMGRTIFLSAALDGYIYRKWSIGLLAGAPFAMRKE